MKPSTAAVLALLEQRGTYGATDRDCLLYAHTSRAAARVWELRAAGHDISTSLETKYGVRFARYRLVTTAPAAREGSAPTSSASRAAGDAVAVSPVPQGR